MCSSLRQSDALIMASVVGLIMGLCLLHNNVFAQPNLNIFGMEDGNYWDYDDGTTYTVEALPPSNYPREYWVQIYFNNSWVGTEMYGIDQGELKLWTLYDEDMIVAMAFDNGLTVAWYPMSVNDTRTSSANVGNYPGTTITVIATVLSYEQVSLIFDTIDAYKIRLDMTVSGPGGTIPIIEYIWVTPYLGRVKFESEGAGVNGISFAIGGGTITQATDFDGDGLKDYLELTRYGTEWTEADTDGDGCEDGTELFGGRDPLTQDPMGDLDMDCTFGLQDAISALKDLDSTDTASNTKKEADLNGDNKIGLHELVYVLQKLSGLR